MGTPPQGPSTFFTYLILNECKLEWFSSAAVGGCALVPNMLMHQAESNAKSDLSYASSSLVPKRCDRQKVM